MCVSCFASCAVGPVPAAGHTHTQAPAFIHTQARMCAHTHARKPAHTHARRSSIDALARRHVHTCTQTHTLYTHSTHTLTCIDPRTHMRDCMQVKPFGRQEIIARINAHLRFRSAVMELAEIEGGCRKEREEDWVGF